ncbi:uncharacterized protein LY89DRAFT_53904 [Mollisia scopiformis]|uniref:Peptidase C14 caspase domain-containing protein n=1 Tax=Mollisia scopiformis TaxID=149040 RepID=A0A194XBC7_MOLSC|nr:uncharacterized protein LY89DRAFT_53904 [Mollisia scopiformis]KUJ17459.1 hypothetical protein LY89DRAFT_53904 [Mollisia scopiformis]
MSGREKATYLVYQQGRDPDKLKLGNLLFFPRNPQEREPFSCPYELDDLSEWTGKPQIDADLAIDVQISHDVSGSVSLSTVFGGDVSNSRSSQLHLEGKNARRYQIDQATDFLNRVVLASPGAREWLNSRTAVSEKIYHLNKLKLGKARHPQIWLVTGIQLLSEVSLRNETNTASKGRVSVQIPPPEPVSGVASILLNNGGVGAKGTISNGATNAVKFSHKEERVWAAQFRRLKLDFVKKAAIQSSLVKEISLLDLQDLGQAGMKGDAQQELDKAAEVVDDDEVDLGDMEANITQEDWDTFDKLLNASKKRALLIGGSEKSLNGVRHDLTAMSDLLIARGFDITLCYGESATRDGIIRAWRHLIQQTSKEDAVVVYYSGHGGCAPKNSGPGLPLQYLLPTDIEESKPGDFRGILDVEVSHLARGLTNKTRNVTIILDCCHAELMSRGPFQVRFYAPVSRETLENHRRQLQESGFFDQSSFYLEGNPHSVRVVACGSDQGAYEVFISDKDQVSMGQMTRELVAVIKDAGDNIISWDAVLVHLRKVLMDPNISAFQRPQVEGEMMRALFSLDRLDYWGQLGLKQRGNNVILMGGLLAGIRDGDEYAIMPLTAVAVDPTKQIAVATVLHVMPTTSKVHVQYFGSHWKLPERSKGGAKAFPLRMIRPELGIEVLVNDTALSDRLSSRLSKSRFVHHFKTGSYEHGPLATIQQENNKLVLIHHRPRPAPILKYEILTNSNPGDAVEDAIYQVEKLAKSDHMLQMNAKPKYTLDCSSVSITMGCVQDSSPVPLPEGDRSVIEEQYVYVKIQNDGTRQVFASIFLVTGIGTISWLSRGDPSGVDILPKTTYTYGENKSNEELEGTRLVWPKSIPRSGDLDESIVVVLSSRHVDLGFLGTAYRHTTDIAGREEAEDVFDQHADQDYLKYSVYHLEFKFKPRIYV